MSHFSASVSHGGSGHVSGIDGSLGPVLGIFVPLVVRTVLVLLVLVLVLLESESDDVSETGTGWFLGAGIAAGVWGVAEWATMARAVSNEQLRERE